MTSQGFDVDLIVIHLFEQVPFQSIGKCHLEISENKNKEKILSFRCNTKFLYDCYIYL